MSSYLYVIAWLFLVKVSLKSILFYIYCYYYYFNYFSNNYYYSYSNYYSYKISLPNFIPKIELISN